VYGDSPRYNDFYIEQLTELLTRYGTISEVWFDGANGEGPSGRKQRYDWPRFWSLVRRLQPNAVMFSDAGPDVRWIGNERGSAGETNWSTMKPDAVPFPGADGPGIIAALQNGDPDGTVWRPGETNVSIRPGWFYHPAEDAKVKSGADLVQLYLTSVGRNSKLLLNVPPTRAGLLHETDVARLPEIQRGIAKLMEGGDVVKGRKPVWRSTADGSIGCEVELPRESAVAVVDLREPIEHGQVVSQYMVEGAPEAAPPSWRVLARGTTIGYRKLDVFTPVAVRRLRITIRTIAPLAEPLQVAAYGASARG
jgi:alpha-L-fucosidase